MVTRSIAGVPRAPVLYALLLLLALAPVARALEGEGSGGTADGWKKVIAYLGCAIAVYGANTPLGVAAAVAECGGLLAQEPAAGGQP